MTQSSDISILVSCRRILPGHVIQPAVLASSIWFGVVAADVWYIARYGLSIPYWDDWVTIPVAAGRQAVSLEFLWAYQGDHRIPLPKLIFIALYRLGNGDVRVIMFANLAILSLLAGLGLMVVHRRRGYLRLSDVLIPLAVAGIANYSNIVSANQVPYFLSIGLFGGAVCAILWDADWFRPRTVVLVGACILCLPFTDSTGVILMLPLLVLLVYGGWVNRHSPRPEIRRMCGIVAGVLLVSLATLAAYILASERPVSPVLSAASGVRQFAVATLQFAAVAFAAPPITAPSVASTANSVADEWVQRLWTVRAAIVVAAGLIATIGLVWEVKRRRATFSTVLGPLACLSSVTALAVIIGLERGSALDQRYIILGATLVFTTYLCLSLVRQTAATLAGAVLALTALVLLPWNAYNAIHFGQARQVFQAALTRDIQAGTSAELLGAKYYADIWGDPALATEAIEEMRDDRIGPFADGSLQLNDAAPAVASAESISIQPAVVHNMTQVGGYWQGTGSDSFLVYTIPPKNLAGIRLTYTLTNPTERPAYLQLDWSEAASASLESPGNRFVIYGAPATNQQQQAVAWVGNTIDTLKVTPDTEASAFKLDSLELLLSP